MTEPRLLVAVLFPDREERRVSMNRRASVFDLKLSAMQREVLEERRRVRVVCGGRERADDEPLAQLVQHLPSAVPGEPDLVVHAVLGAPGTAAPDPEPQPADSGTPMGAEGRSAAADPVAELVRVALFIFAVLWVVFFTRPDLFSGFSRLALVVLTVLFAAWVIQRRSTPSPRARVS